MNAPRQTHLWCETYTIAGDPCRIVVGSGCVREVFQYSPQVVVYEEALANRLRHTFVPAAELSVKGGEPCKQFARVEEFFREFVRLGVQRRRVIAAIGGGALLDTVAFAACTFKRGIPFVAIPTTLLAQVDAALGGKNGVNLAGIKNQVGSVRQPQAVLIDPELLATLPQREFVAGLAEVVKIALLRDAPLFAFLEQNVQAILNREISPLNQIIVAAVRGKMEIVVQDPLDDGIRQILNFGHSVAHVLELGGGMLHGEAVSIGMVAELDFAASRRQGAPDVRARVNALLQRFGLPVTLPQTDTSSVRSALQNDKKVFGDEVALTRIFEIGRGELYRAPLRELLAVLS